MCYDPVDHYVVLFGGLGDSARALNSTWTFAGGTWSNITSTAGTSPSARDGMDMTYDASDHYILAFGGVNSITPTNDTWAFVGGRWHQLAVTGAPSYPEWVGMAYDSADAYVLLLGMFNSDLGQAELTYTYHGGVWTPVTSGNNSTLSPEPSLREQFALTYDAHDGYILLFGGFVDGSARILGDTWVFSAGKWSNITATLITSPSPRYGAQVAYDDTSGDVILFGGSPRFGGNGTPITELNDTWSFVGGAWTNKTPTQSPVGVYAAGFANDSFDSGVLLFGGIFQRTGFGIINDTWIWSVAPPLAGVSIANAPPAPEPLSPTNFTVSFKGGVAPLNYDWLFGDGGESTSMSPTHVYSTVGFYLVQLWLNDSAGHLAHVSLRVHVFIPLTITSIDATPNPAILDSPVNFSANVIGGNPPYTYSWTFGDGGVGGNLSSITHIYSTNGPFISEVTVADAAGDAIHAELNISIMLQAIAGSSVGSGTSSLMVSFVGQAEGGIPPYAYSWNFGDGSISTEQNPSHTYALSGHFAVVLTVTDGRGNRSMSTLAIQVGEYSAASGMGSSWYIEFVVAGGIAMIVAGAWGASSFYKRSQRREGEKWIEELTDEKEPSIMDRSR